MKLLAWPVVLLVLILLVVPVVGQQTNSATREKRIATTLDLFGEADSLGGKAPDFATVLDMIEIAKQALQERKLAQGWPRAAKNVAARYKDVFITVKTTKQPTLEKVRSILGQEDSTEVDKEASVTWYKYGWCHFGVAQKKIIILRAECNLVQR